MKKQSETTSRRDFLTGISAACVLPTLVFFVPSIAQAQEHSKDAFWRRDRFLSLHRIGINEKLHLCYFKGGRYDSEAYGRICWIMRDFKDQNRWTQIDIDLIDNMWALQEWQRQQSGKNSWWYLTSAYRTRRRNSSIEGAAFNSQHIHGRAMDGVLDGLSIKETAERAKHLNVGGIGIYNNFLHIDSGNVRIWKG